jgi:hypothetical protein
MFSKRKGQDNPAPSKHTFPEVPPSLKAHAVVVEAAEFGKRLAALCSEGTPEEVKASFPSDQKREEVVEMIDDCLDALAALIDTHPHLAPDIDPLAQKLTEYQLYISGI